MLPFPFPSSIPCYITQIYFPAHSQILGTFIIGRSVFGTAITMVSEENADFNYFFEHPKFKQTAPKAGQLRR